MKQVFILATVLCGVLLLPARTIQAATPPADPAAFGLSPRYFPRPASILVSVVESNAQAASNQLIVHFGTASLASLGRTTGYFMQVAQANLDNKGKTHPVFTHLFVSAFGTPDQATAAFQQEKAGWEGLVTLPTSSETVTVQPFNGQQFGDLSAEGLYVDKITTSQGTGDVSFLLFKRGSFLIEVWQSVADAAMQKYGAPAQAFIFSIGKALDAIAQGLAPPTLPKPTVDYSIMSVRFETNNLQFDLTKAPLTRVRAGTTVEAGVYFALRDAPPNAVLHDTFKVTWKGHSLQKKFSHKFGAYPPDYWHFVMYNLTLKNLGTYKVAVTLTINGVTRRGSASIQVVRHLAAASSRAQRFEAKLAWALASLRDPAAGLARQPTQLVVRRGR